MTEWSAEVSASLGRLQLDVQISGGSGPVALIGPNGGGKSTLLRILVGSPTRAVGRARFQLGERLLHCTTRGIEVPIEQRGIGYVPQGNGLFPHLTVLENVAFGWSTGSGRRRKGERLDAANLLLADLACGHLGARLPARLSGGEQQRVALARALLTEPSFLLLDEPLAALDAGTRRSVRHFLAERLRRAGCPSLMVTHDPRDVLALAADVYVLEDGKIVQHGTLAGLKAAPATDFVAEFTDSLDLSSKEPSPNEGRAQWSFTISGDERP